jgi:hypothetical protein
MSRNPKEIREMVSDSNKVIFILLFLKRRCDLRISSQIGPKSNRPQKIKMKKNK